MCVIDVYVCTLCVCNERYFFFICFYIVSSYEEDKQLTGKKEKRYLRKRLKKKVGDEGKDDVCG
jgi:hypothetical protein